MAETIRNPIEWGRDQLQDAAAGVSAAGHALGHIPETLHSPRPTVRRIGMAELWHSLACGAEDFAACRSDVIFLCAFYPVAGIVLARLVFGENMLPLLFPLIAGFALLGPLAAVGLLEMSRRREQGEVVTWATAFRVVHAPSFAAIVMLGLLVLAIFLVWLGVAALIYRVTLGPALPVLFGGFVHDVFTTLPGWTMMVVGIGVGFLFAVLVLTIGVVSFALLLDRDAGIDTAISTSVHAVAKNPGPMAVWGVVTAGGLVVGSLPLLIGLAVVFPILGHATWHLYRKVVTPPL